MVEGVVDLYANLTDHRGERHRCCRREVAQHIRRDKSHRYSNVAEEVRDRVLEV